MPRRSPAALAALALGAMLLGACDDRSPVAPADAGVRASLDAGALDAVDADTGDLVLWPSDGPTLEEPTEGEVLFSMAAAAAEETPRDTSIRIGVVQSSATILLGSLADYTVKDKGTGVTLTSGTNGSVTVSLIAAPEAYIYIQVMCSSIADVTKRKAEAEALGYYTFVDNHPTLPCVRLSVGRLPTTSTTAQRNAFEGVLMTQKLAPSDGSGFPRSITIGTQTLYRVVRGTFSTQSVNPVVVTSSTGIVTIGASASARVTYRGKGEARVNSQATLAGINELPMEQYLYGVVPRELGPVAFPEVEAQKAQAVAARTYALAGFRKRNTDGYDLRATTDDQVYGGYAAEHPVSSAAVDATRGVVATYSRALISALFSSTSGGHTADSEEAFANALPYLRGIVDSDKNYPPGLTPTKESIRGSDDLRILRQTRTQDFETDWAGRFHRWTFDWTQAEIASVVATSLNKPVTTVYEINELRRGPSGRVLALEYVTNVGRDTVRKDAIRSSLRFIDANGARQSLLSTLFFIVPTDEKGHEVRRQSYGATDAPVPAGFRVFGAGWGHGVGLAQTGAVGMAQAGYDYEAILKRYYTGIDLTTWHQLVADR